MGTEPGCKAAGRAAPPSGAPAAPGLRLSLGGFPRKSHPLIFSLKEEEGVIGCLCTNIIQSHTSLIAMALDPSNLTMLKMKTHIICKLSSLIQDLCVNGIVLTPAFQKKRLMEPRGGSEGAAHGISVADMCGR